jgi:AraC-like DNA-binding protein
MTPAAPRRTAATPANLLVPISTVGSAPRLLTDAGASAIKTACAAGLDPVRFENPTHTISFAEIGRYLAECVVATRDETFPLRLGIAEGLTALNAVGYLAQHAPDVRTALHTIREHVHHFSGAIHVTDKEDVATLDYRFLLPRIFGADLIAEAGMGIAVSILRQLCGPAWNPLELRLQRAFPQQPTNWQQCIQAPVRFAAERNQLVFSAQWLNHRLERANQELRRLMLDRVAELDAERGDGFSSQVCSVIRASLVAGDASIESIARKFELNPRTLRRRLSAQETSFDELLEKTRVEVAIDLLESSAASMTQIADLLGYAHSSTFSRAVRRWTNTSPRDFRLARLVDGRRESRGPQR